MPPRPAAEPANPRRCLADGTFFEAGLPIKRGGLPIKRGGLPIKRGADYPSKGEGEPSQDKKRHTIEALFREKFNFLDEDIEAIKKLSSSRLMNMLSDIKHNKVENPQRIHS